MMNSEKLSPQKSDRKRQLKEGIQILKFFNHRIREELKNRESANDESVETPQSYDEGRQSQHPELGQ